MSAVDGGGTSIVRIMVCYDGCWYQHARRYFTSGHGPGIRLAGLHDVIRWHAAAVFGCPVGQVAVTQAHYVAGRDGPCPALDSELASHAITRHDVPVTAKGEVGGDVELALTCYQAAIDTSPDMIALITGDGDFAPLAARLTGRGIRVLVPVANFSYPDPATGAPVTVTTSGLLTRAATDTPALTDLIATADTPGYPAHLARPRPPARAPNLRDGALRHGTITRWDPDSDYGFLTSDDGTTWFAARHDVPALTPLPPLTPVTFTGSPAPTPGKNYPRARAIRPTAVEPAPHDTTQPAPATPPPSSAGSPMAALDSAALTRLRTAQALSRAELARRAGLSVTRHVEWARMGAGRQAGRA